MPLAVHLANEEMMWVVYKQRTLNFATKFEISWLICKYIFYSLFIEFILWAKHISRCCGYSSDQNIKTKQNKTTKKESMLRKSLKNMPKVTQPLNNSWNSN